MSSDDRQYPGEKVARQDTLTNYPDWKIVDCSSYAEILGGEIWSLDLERKTQDGTTESKNIKVFVNQAGETATLEDESSLVEHLQFLYQQQQQAITEERLRNELSASPKFVRILDALFSHQVIAGLLAIFSLASAVIVSRSGDGEVPQELWALVGLAFGFFFGRSQSTSQQK